MFQDYVIVTKGTLAERITATNKLFNRMFKLQSMRGEFEEKLNEADLRSRPLKETSLDTETE